MAICQLCSIQLQKEVKSIQKQPSCKKFAAPKKAIVKKDMLSKVAAKNGCDGSYYYQNFNNDNSGEFGENCSEMFEKLNSAELLLLNFCQ